jgi:hypothetical protein
VVSEYQRFLAILLNESLAGNTFAPSSLIDGVYNLDFYRKNSACHCLAQKHSFELIRNSSRFEDFDARFDFTKTVYYEIYGTAPPDDIWKQSGKSVFYLTRF